MSSACARPMNGIKARCNVRRVRTTCTGFSFQIVQFLDSLYRLHQRVFGRTPPRHAAIWPNVRGVVQVRYPPYAPHAAGKEDATYVPWRSLIHALCATAVAHVDSPVP